MNTAMSSSPPFVLESVFCYEHEQDAVVCRRGANFADEGVRARIDLHRKYNFINYLPAYINIKHPGGGFDLTGKIKATNFVQKKNEEHAKPDLVAKPVVKLAQAETFELTEAKEERLSQIIAEIKRQVLGIFTDEIYQSLRSA